MQMCEFMSAHTTAGILFIISRIIKDRTDLVSLRGILEVGADAAAGGSTDLSRYCMSKKSWSIYRVTYFIKWVETS